MNKMSNDHLFIAHNLSIKKKYHSVHLRLNVLQLVNFNMMMKLMIIIFSSTTTHCEFMLEEFHKYF